jgi:hypothetical protein
MGIQSVYTFFLATLYMSCHLAMNRDFMDTLYSSLHSGGVTPIVAAALCKSADAWVVTV